MKIKLLPSIPIRLPRLRLPIKLPRFKILRKPFEILGALLEFLREMIFLIKERVEKSLRMQVIATFILCLVAAFVVAMFSGSLFSKMNRYAMLDYSNGVESIDYYARRIVSELGSDFHDWTQEEWNTHVQDTLDQWTYKLKGMIVDMDGNVLFKSKNAVESRVNIQDLIENTMDQRLHSNSYSQEMGEVTSFYPVTLQDTNAYVVVSGIPNVSIVYREEGGGFLAVICGFVTFIFLFYFLTQKKMKYIEELANGLLEISKGNLDYRVKQRSKDELGSLASNINFMAKELEIKIEEERRAEKLKHELITNVSHDLRTPLTSIMGYLNLLKDGKYEDREKAKEYLNIAYSKSERLKVLMEDLFEYTKLSNQGIELQKENVHLNELIGQLTEELVPLAEGKSISFEHDFSKEKLITSADADKLVRVFENLLMNAIHYSYKPGKITVRTYSEENSAIVVVENQGEAIPQEDLDRIFDRFFRVEKSRSSSTGGSGLGLSIAKNIIELHGGCIWARCEKNIIRFFVRLPKIKE